MADIFPALGAIYPPASLTTFEYPYSNIGIHDRGAQKFNDSRVIVHKNRLIVGTDSPRGPQTLFSAEVQEVFKDSTGQDLYTRVVTTNGYLVVFSKSKSCGCGSRLRSWNPYGNIVSA